MRVKVKFLVNRVDTEEVYNLDNLLLRRLEHVIGTKYITQNSGYYQNTDKGRFQARLFKFVKEYLHLGPGG